MSALIVLLNMVCLMPFSVPLRDQTLTVFLTIVLFYSDISKINSAHFFSSVKVKINQKSQNCNSFTIFCKKCNFGKENEFALCL